MADAWDGLKTLTGEKKNMSSGSHMPAEEQVKFSNELNDFYCRFERDDLGEDINSVVLELKEKISECEEGKDLEINANIVESLFMKLNVKKATGPDSIRGKLLKVCASQLCSVFANLFNWSLRECCVPSVWTNSVICPILKKKNPSSLSDYRPVALTSIVMKCFEKLVLRRLLTFTNEHLDPLQFAYKPRRGSDDAILTVLHNAFLHLDKAGSYVRILFIDFSSAFNTIQPYLLALKLLHLDVNPKLILWRGTWHSWNVFACIQSVLVLSFMCWYGSLGVRGKKVLNDAVNMCSKVVGKKQTCMQDFYERWLKRKDRQIAGDQSHVLEKFFELLPSGRWYRTLKGKARLPKTLGQTCSIALWTPTQVSSVIPIVFSIPNSISAILNICWSFTSEFKDLRTKLIRVCLH